jgi:glycosyltransferase involved in cell wall biosynthesis
MTLNQWATTHAFAANAEKLTAGYHFDVVHAYDNYALVAAARLSSRADVRVVYDAVEIASARLFNDNASRIQRISERWQRREEARIVLNADAMIGTGDSLSDWYAKTYRISKPLVVRNCRYYWQRRIDGRLRADINAKPDTRILLWCGHIYPQQGVEVAMQMLPHLPPNIHLVIVADALPAWKKYVTEELPALAASMGVADRMHFLPARGPNDLIPYISDSDIGLVLSIPVNHPNQYHNMPNKFFEYVMARVPIATLAFPEPSSLINKYNIGRILTEDDAVQNAKIIRDMLESETYTAFKASIEGAALALSWEQESRPLIELVDTLMPASLREKAAASRTARQPSAAIASQPMSSVMPGAAIRPVERNKAVNAKASESKKNTERAPPSSVDLQNRAVNAFLALAHYCYAKADELQADAYVAHGVEALPAAQIVANSVGGRIYCDVIETPSFGQRSSQYNYHPTNMAMLDHAFDGYLRNADGISTIGWAMADQLRSYGPPVSVLPNYRYAEELQPSQELRERCGIGPDSVLLLASSTICSGFEPVIEALRLLPDNVHLATLGEIVPYYRDKIRSYPTEIGVQGRVHFYNEVPYARLTAVASGANLSLMAIDPARTNDRLSLPNRFFDSIAAEVPVVTPDVQDIARIVRERQIGIVVERNEAHYWAEGISAALASEKEMRPRVRQAAKELVWDLLTDELHAAYGNPERVTIIGYGNLVGHQRTLRMADSFVKRGVQVTICCPQRKAEAPPEIPGVRFVFIPHPQTALPSASVPAKSPPARDYADAAD